MRTINRLYGNFNFIQQKYNMQDDLSCCRRPIFSSLTFPEFTVIRSQKNISSNGKIQKKRNSDNPILSMQNFSFSLKLHHV